MTKYHVTPKWDGNNLQTSYQRHESEDEAISEFMAKCPNADKEFARDQIRKIYFYDLISQALEHQLMHGGEILEINDDELIIETDPIEGWPCTWYTVDKEFIGRLQ